MNNDRDIPREERATQGMLAIYLREEAAKLPDLKLGPSDLDRIALMLTRGYSSANHLSMEKMAADVGNFMQLYAKVFHRIHNDLADIRRTRNGRVADE
jgi:hypothetical protein